MESYGYELLQAVGATYAARGRQYNLTNSSAFGGVIGWGLGFKVNLIFIIFHFFFLSYGVRSLLSVYSRSTVAIHLYLFQLTSRA